MKFSKKIRFLFSLTSLLICLCLGNVVVYADEMIMPQEEMETSLDDVITYANGKISLSQAKTLAEQWVSMATQLAGVSYDEQLNLGEIYSSQTDFFENFAKTAGEEGCGQYLSYDDVKVEETDNKGKVDITAVIHFEKKNLRMTMHTMCFETIEPQVTSVEFALADAGKETFDDKMKTAAGNTLMGMGTVFLVLIFISCIISLFGFIPKLLGNRTKGNTESITENTPVPVNTESENNLKDDSELIAVIAAAIAASEQTSTDSFVVRSIRRR